MSGPRAEKRSHQPLSFPNRLSKESLKTIFSRNKVTDVGRDGAVCNTVSEPCDSRSMAFINPRSRVSIAIARPLIRSQPSAQSLSSAVSNPFKSCRSRHITPWDPPPLFQAYPQSITHALLEASCLDTDMVLRSNRRRRQKTDKNAYKEAIRTDSIVNTRKEIPEKRDRKHTPSKRTEGWTRKLFVLVTSGYLLQYAGEGHHNRLPEKMMRLGSNTVAFASDAIPGRHWVLQVSQSAGEGELTLGSSKRTWSRLGTRNPESRCISNDFLLVFNNADELDAWLLTVRQEIEALGSAKYRLDTAANGHTKQMSEHKVGQCFQLRNDTSWMSNPPLTSSCIANRPSKSSAIEGKRDSTTYALPAELQLLHICNALPRPSSKASCFSSSTHVGDYRYSQSPVASATTESQTSYEGSSASSPTTDSFSASGMSSFDTSRASIGKSFIPARRYPLDPESFEPRQQHSYAEPTKLFPRRDCLNEAATARNMVSRLVYSDLGLSTSECSSTACGAVITACPAIIYRRLSDTTLRLPPSPPLSFIEGDQRVEERQAQARRHSGLAPPPASVLFLQPPNSCGADTVHHEYVAATKTTQFTNVNNYRQDLTNTNDLDLAPSSTELLIRPKRLSSLQYAPGVLPSSTSLFACNTTAYSDSDSACGPRVLAEPHAASLIDAATIKLRRPVSMSLQTGTGRRADLPPRSTSRLSSHESDPKTTFSSRHYSRDRRKLSNSTMSIASTMQAYKSMPNIGLGPPACPPPDCPLPDVPQAITTYPPSSALSH